jgi:muramoyltetrapeptide carboxypeptidase
VRDRASRRAAFPCVLIFGLAAVVHRIIKPAALRPGDTVGVVALAAAVERDALEKGAAALSELGYRVKLSPHLLDRRGILAGCDQVRASELAAFFKDSEVCAIFAARGGYGCGRLLPMLDFAAIARTPKIFMGFSDTTFLLNAMVDHAHLVCFHGPMVAMDFARGLGARCLNHLQSLLGGAGEFALRSREVLRGGSAEGELIGGCLSVVAAMMATPWQPRFEGRILFLEDTGEKAYRIDRMLVQMRQAGVFDRVAGVVFGALRPPGESQREREMTAEFVAEQTRGLACPVLFGIEAGHGSENLALPFGIKARLDGARGMMLIEESAVA